MKFSIVPADEVVYVESESHKVDMSDMPEYVHAVQWYGAYGDIEFKPDKDGKKLPNIKFNDHTPFDFMVDRWRQRKRRVEDQKKRQEEEKMAKIEETKRTEAAQRSERPM